jgi:Protein tyrosine and serine/threonine kinase
MCRMNDEHVVKLIGFCIEEREQFLLYEYMAQGNLEKVLFHGMFSILFIGNISMKFDMLFS